jgi:hypothetical protein
LETGGDEKSAIENVAKLVEENRQNIHAFGGHYNQVSVEDIKKDITMDLSHVD